jgi:hypothetical protein
MYVNYTNYAYCLIEMSLFISFKDGKPAVLMPKTRVK